MDNNTANTQQRDCNQEITGQCFCGKAAYQISNTAGFAYANLCHCDQCQQFSGSAFSAKVEVDSTSFRWLRGAGFVKRFRSDGSSVSYVSGEHTFNHAFCMNCGSPMPIESCDGKTVKVPLGSLDKNNALYQLLSIQSNQFWVERAIWLDQSLLAKKYDGQSK